jgi:hypothetical protein
MKVNLKVVYQMVYDGEFKESLPNGHGKRENSDGSIYEGEFKDGLLKSSK